MVKKIDYEKLNNVQCYCQWATFKAIPGALGADRTQAITQAQEFFAALEAEGNVTVRGIYDITGGRAEADFMFWWHAEEFSYIKDAYNRFRRDLILGQSSEVFWLGNGLHRPSEFNKSHLPSFIMGEEPGDWIAVYPFVRSYDWYVMDPTERRRILAEHGRTARPFSDVLSNTVEAFALGDYEWMLAFEAKELHRIVDLMHQMRYTDARLHVRKEIPFFTGRRVTDVADLVKVLP